MNSAGTSSGPSASNLHQAFATHLTRQSNLTDTERIHQQAVQRVRDMYDDGKIPKDIYRFLVSRATAEEVLDVVASVKARNQKSKTPLALTWLTRGGRWSVESLERFSKCIDVLVQTRSEVASPIWGSIRIMLVIAEDIFETYERLEQLVKKISHCLARYSEYLPVMGLEGLLSARLVDFYEVVLRFCFEAVRVHIRGGWRIVGASAWGSLKQPFESLLKDLTDCSDEVDKVVNMKHMAESKKDRELGRRRQRSIARPPSPTSFSVPGLLSKHFTGRQDILQALQNTFQKPFSHRTPRKAALWGIPGVGKSQILYKYADATRGTYDRVFFVRAEGKPQLVSDFRMIARVLHLSDADDKDLEERHLIEEVKAVLRSCPNWLLIFDNVQNSRDVAEFLPDTGAGDVLFSMRNEVCSRALVDEDFIFEVKPWEEANTIDLVRRLLRSPLQNPTLLKAAEELHKLVAGLPIAVEQAVVLSERTKVPLPAVVQNLKTRRDKVLAVPNPASSHETSLATTVLFHTAMEKLAASHPQAAALLKVMVYLDTSAIPLDLLETGSAQLKAFLNRAMTFDRGAFRSQTEEHLAAERKIALNKGPGLRSLSELLRDSKLVQKLFPTSASSKTDVIESSNDILLRHHLARDVHLRDVLGSHNLLENAVVHLEASGLLKRTDVNSVSIHDLVRDIYIEMLQTSKMHQVNALCALTLVFLAFPIPQRFHRPTVQLCQRYLSHALSTLKLSEGFSFDTVVGPELTHLTASTIHWFHRSKHGAEELDAMPFYRGALKGYMAAWRRAQAKLGDVDVILNERDEFDTSLQGCYFDRFFAGYERFGQAPQRALNTVVKMAGLHTERGAWAEAGTCARQAYTGYEVVFGEHHYMTFELMGLRIRIALGAKDWGAASMLSLRRVTMFRHMYGSLSSGFYGAACAVTVSISAERLQFYEEAIAWRRSSLPGLALVHGADSPRLAPTLLHLARVYRKMWNHESARAHCLRAMELHGEQDSSSYVMNEARYGLAISQEVLGNLAEAEGLWMELLETVSSKAMAAQADTYDEPRAFRLKIVWNVCRYSDAVGKDVPSRVDAQLIVEAEKRYGAFAGKQLLDNPFLVLETDFDFQG